SKAAPAVISAPRINSSALTSTGPRTNSITGTGTTVAAVANANAPLVAWEWPSKTSPGIKVWSDVAIKVSNRSRQPRPAHDAPEARGHETRRGDGGFGEKPLDVSVPRYPSMQCWRDRRAGGAFRSRQGGVSNARWPADSVSGARFRTVNGTVRRVTACAALWDRAACRASAVDNARSAVGRSAV